MPDPCITDTPSVDLVMQGSLLSANAKVSQAYDNGMSIQPDGMWVPGRQVAAVLPDQTIRYNGQVVRLRPTSGITWMMVLNTDSGLTFPWEFIGGASMFSNIEGSVSQTTDASPAGAWGNGGGGSVGPDLTVPFTGLYDVEYEATVDNSASASGSTSIGIAQGIAADPIANLTALQSNIRSTHLYATYRLNLTQGVVLRMRYRSTIPSNTATYSDRRLRIKPVRL